MLFRLNFLYIFYTVLMETHLQGGRGGALDDIGIRVWGGPGNKVI